MGPGCQMDQTPGVGGSGVREGGAQGVGHFDSWSASTTNNLHSLRSCPLSHSYVTPTSSVSPGNFWGLEPICQPGYSPVLRNNHFCFGCQNWGNVHYFI